MEGLTVGVLVAGGAITQIGKAGAIAMSARVALVVT